MTRAFTLAFAAFLIAAAAAGPTLAANEDPRTPITLPADVRAAFLEHMRQHMNSLDDVIIELASHDFKGAARVARDELVPGSGAGFGRYLPVDFRELGLGMHRAAADFADVADAVPAEPTAADWEKVIEALRGISTHCRACHSAYRLQ
jgi:hypothetical protein